MNTNVLTKLMRDDSLAYSKWLRDEPKRIKYREGVIDDLYDEAEMMFVDSGYRHQFEQLLWEIQTYKVKSSASAEWDVRYFEAQLSKFKKVLSK